jgi:hypothetical protein
MGTYREQDALATLLVREQSRVLDCIKRFASGDGAGVLAEARRVLHALGDVEEGVLYPAFTRVSLRPETQRLLDDSRGTRAQQLAALDVLAHKRAARLRKLAAVALCDAIEHHGAQHVSRLIPVLASQLPRPLYRSIVQTFISRYQGELDQAARMPAPRRQRTMASSI